MNIKNIIKLRPIIIGEGTLKPFITGPKILKINQ